MAQEIIPRVPPIPPTAMEVVKEHRAFYRKSTPEYAMFSGIIAAARYRRDTLHILQLLRDAVLAHAGNPEMWAAARDASREIIRYEHPHP